MSTIQTLTPCWPKPSQWCQHHVYLSLLNWEPCLDPKPLSTTQCWCLPCHTMTVKRMMDATSHCMHNNEHGYQLTTTPCHRQWPSPLHCQERCQAKSPMSTSRSTPTTYTPCPWHITHVINLACRPTIQLKAMWSPLLLGCQCRLDFRNTFIICTNYYLQKPV